MSNELEHKEVEDGMHLIAFPPRADGGNCIVLPSAQCPVCRAEKAERERDKANGLLWVSSDALVLAAAVLMRPVEGEPDNELLVARMSVLKAQDLTARAAGEER